MTRANTGHDPRVIYPLKMSRNNQPPDISSDSLSRKGIWSTIGAASLILIPLLIWQSPTYSFHPLCTYTVNAQISADVVIAGQKLSSTVIYQDGRSRQWIAMINSAGCKPMEGNALTYRLAKDRVLIVSAQICHAGARELAKSGRLDILSACKGKQAHQDLAYLVDSATLPSKWTKVTNGVEFQIDSMTAASTWSNSRDDITSLAPNLLKSDFKLNGQKWSWSPERMIPFHRRYDFSRHRPDPSFEFKVNYEPFEVE